MSIRSILKKPLKGPLRFVGWLLALSIPAGLIGLLVYSSIESDSPRVRELARRTKCLFNLYLLASAQELYAKDHNGAFSEKLSDLYPDYVSDFDLFTCPSADGPKVTRKEDIDSLTSYVLRKGMTQAARPNEVLIYEKLGNHGEDGGNAVYVRGQARWLSDSELRKIIEKDRGKEE